MNLDNLMYVLVWSGVRLRGVAADKKLVVVCSFGTCVTILYNVGKTVIGFV